MSSDINKIIVSGCVGKDPIIQHFNTDNNGKYARFSIACNKFRYKEGTYIQNTSWFSIFVINEQQVRKCEQIKQGDKLLITGRMEQSTRKSSTSEYPIVSFSIIVDNNGSIETIKKSASNRSNDDNDFYNNNNSNKPHNKTDASELGNNNKNNFNKPKSDSSSDDFEQNSNNDMLDIDLTDDIPF